MSFSRAKPAGWAFGEILTSAQQNQLDIEHANAVDGVNGGTYSLASPLQLNAALVRIEILESQNFEVTGSATIDTANVTDDLDVGNDLTVAGATQLASLEVGGNQTLGGRLGYSGTGRFLITGQNLPNSNASVDIAAFRVLTAQSTVTATRVYTLSCTNAADYDWFVFQNLSGSNQSLAGLVAPTIPNNTGVLYMRVSGSWTLMMTWTN